MFKHVIMKIAISHCTSFNVAVPAILDDETDACSSLNGDDQDKVSALNELTSIPSLSNQKNTVEAFSGKHCYYSKRSRITSRTDPLHLLKGTRKRRLLLIWDHSLTVRRYTPQIAL